MFFVFRFFFFSFYSLQNNDLNPIWNEHFEFIVEDEATQHLIVKIYDSEGLQSSELIGCAEVRLSELEPGRVKDKWLKLVKDLELQRDNKNRGQVRNPILFMWLARLKLLMYRRFLVWVKSFLTFEFTFLTPTTKLSYCVYSLKMVRVNRM